MNMVMLDKIQEELLEGELMTIVPGSMGQMKQDAHPLLAHYDKLQRTLIQQFQALSLNYNATPSKVKESMKQGVDEEDPMANYYKDRLFSLTTREEVFRTVRELQHVLR